MTGTEDAAPQAKPPATRPSRGNQSFGDMLRSIAVLMAIVLVAFGLVSWLTPSNPSPVRTIDYKSVAADAARVAPFDIAVPDSLPEGWRATSASYESGGAPAWHLGVLATEQEFVGLEESTLAEAAMVQRYADGSEDAGTTSVDGQAWAVRRNADSGETILVRQVSGVTTLLVGTVSQTDLEIYASSLTTA